MAKIIFGNATFDELSLGSLYETEVELALKQRAHRIFPGFMYSDFKCIVSNNYDQRKPDFALIEENYRSWWVCELETANHSLDGHVLPQVRTFLTGTYGEAALRWLLRARPDLDPDRLRLLVKNEQPQVLVVVNKFSEHWAKAITNVGAYLGVFEIFRSSEGQIVFRVNGYVPTPEPERLSICEIDPMLPRLIRIRSPGALSFVGGATYTVSRDGALAEWRAVVTGDAVWLSPIKGAQLPKQRVFALTRDSFQNLYFVPIRRGEV